MDRDCRFIVVIDALGSLLNCTVRAAWAPEANGSPTREPKKGTPTYCNVFLSYTWFFFYFFTFWYSIWCLERKIRLFMSLKRKSLFVTSMCFEQKIRLFLCLWNKRVYFLPLCAFEKRSLLQGFFKMFEKDMPGVTFIHFDPHSSCSLFS